MLMHGHRKRDHSSHAHAPAAHGPATGIPAPSKRLLGVLCVAQLMVILDITAVNVALPDMAKSLDIQGGTIAWAITSYSVVFGSLLLLGGRLADLVGRRRVFMTGPAGVTLASVAGPPPHNQGPPVARR